MRNLILILSLWGSTQVQAESLGQYNTQDKSYEVSYDELAQELAMKKGSQKNDSPTQFLGFSQVNAIFGYSFSNMDLNLKSGSSSFNLSGADVRINGQLTNSTWHAEGGLKNYGRITNGNKSAESRVLTTALKNQDRLNGNLQYVAGVGTSFHWIEAKDLMAKKSEVDLSLNVSAGIRGALTNQLSWGVDLNAYSPISGRLLKGGLDAAVVLALFFNFSVVRIIHSSHPFSMAEIRDVTGTSIIAQLKIDFHFIMEFLKNPIQKISHFPNWSWKKIILINVLLSIVAGTLNGLIPPNIYNIAYGLFFMPLMTLILIHILSGFFYYYFQVFEKRTVDFLNLLRMVVLAHIPYLILHCLTSLLPPLILLGFAFSALLLVVGLTESFSLDKKRAIKLVSILYVMVFLVWLWEKIDTRNLSRAISSAQYKTQTTKRFDFQRT